MLKIRAGPSPKPVGDKMQTPEALICKGLRAKKFVPKSEKIKGQYI